jgi:hypothetical protein
VVNNEASNTLEATMHEGNVLRDFGSCADLHELAQKSVKRSRSADESTSIPVARLGRVNLSRSDLRRNLSADEAKAASPPIREFGRDGYRKPNRTTAPKPLVQETASSSPEGSRRFNRTSSTGRLQPNRSVGSRLNTAMLTTGMTRVGSDNREISRRSRRTISDKDKQLGNTKSKKESTRAEASRRLMKAVSAAEEPEAVASGRSRANERNKSETPSGNRRSNSGAPRRPLRVRSGPSLSMMHSNDSGLEATTAISNNYSSNHNRKSPPRQRKGSESKPLTHDLVEASEGRTKRCLRSSSKSPPGTRPIRSISTSCDHNKKLKRRTGGRSPPVSAKTARTGSNPELGKHFDEVLSPPRPTPLASLLPRLDHDLDASLSEASFSDVGSLIDDFEIDSSTSSSYSNTGGNGANDAAISSMLARNKAILSFNNNEFNSKESNQRKQKLADAVLSIGAERGREKVSQPLVMKSSTPRVCSDPSLYSLHLIRSKSDTSISSLVAITA